MRVLQLIEQWRLRRKIPRGFYCYDDKGNCPYWSLDSSHEYQENGYCAYLDKGDWDINKEKLWMTGRGSDAPREEWKTAEQLGEKLSLLWDRVKECPIKN